MSLVIQDSAGQLWQIDVNTDGSLQSTPVAGGGSFSVGSRSTVTVQTVVNLCMTHVDLMPIANVGGFTNEPALSLANDVLQELLASPYDWKFNSKTAPILMTAQARQDYLFAGACAFTQTNSASIDLATNAAISEVGNVVTVQCLQQHNFSVGDTVFINGATVAAYNSTFLQTPTSSSWTNGYVITAVPTSTSFKFTHTSSGLATSGAPGIFDCSWLASATMIDSTNTSPNPQVYEVTAVKTLKPASAAGRPSKISLVSDGNGTGVLSLRLDHIPTVPVYAITFNYQAKAPLLTSLAQTWAPFPDEFGFVYRQAFLARAYRYLDHRRADAEEARSLAMINKALGKDDVELSDQSVTPTHSIMDYSW